MTKPTHKCHHTTSSDGIEIKPCLACQTTPKEKCLPFCQCNKCCGDLSSPSPEAHCLKCRASTFEGKCDCECHSPEARVDWEKIYEPWIIGLNKATLELGCFRTYAEAQDRLDNFIMNNMTTATLCSSGITEKILYKAAFEKGREAR